MQEITIENINGGKPFKVELINLVAQDEIQKFAGMKKTDAAVIRGIVYATLISSDSITERNEDVLREWSKRIKMPDAMRLTLAFEEVNHDFFMQMKTKAAALPMTAQVPDTSSPPPSITPSNTPTASSSTTPSN